MTLLGAAAVAACAAWLSQGTIGFTSPDGGRVALAPLTWASAWLPAAAALSVVLLARLGASLIPITLLALIFLPWLPLPVPAAFLIWAGPATLVIWVATALLMAASIPAERRPRLPLARPALAAGCAAFLVFALSAWRAAPVVPGGDEPHYLVITQSLLLDGDLRIENNHQRGDYRAYFAGPLRPDFLRRGRDGEIYSIHAPGISALVLPAFAVAGYRGAVLFLVGLAAAASALAWLLAWKATRRADAAWFGWAAVTLPATAVFQSFTVYPDGVGGLLVLTGVWALLRAEEERASGSAAIRPWLLHGAALALLPWLHTRFAILAGGLGALVLLRLAPTRNPAAKAVAFLAVPAVSALLWIGYFIAIYGTPDPSAPYGRGEIGSFVWVPGGLAGLLFDQRFGLLVYAPVLAVAFAGLGIMIARPAWRRSGLELLFAVAPYLITVTHFPMWWGGWSAPARFFAPVLPLMAVPAAVAWTAIERRASRALALGALAFTAFATAILVFVDRGRLAFNVRDTPALWLEWAGRAADLVHAAPSWTRTTDAPLFRAIAVWLAAVALVWIVLRAVERRLAPRPGALSTAAAWALAAAAMAGASIVWRMERVDGRTVVAAQLGLLRAAASTPRALAVDLDTRRRIASDALPRRLRIELSRPVPGRSAARDDRALFTIPALPAGEYRVMPVADAPRGWLMLGINADQFALWTGPIPSPTQPIALRFPVMVRGLIVRGDEDARQVVRGLRLEPVSLRPAGAQLTRAVARRAVVHGETTVFFLDDHSFPEPEAFWVGGARSSAVLFQPRTAGGVQPFLLRNAPVENRVAIEAGAWRTGLQLAPGEERRLEVPIDPAHGAALVRFTVDSGFRPSDHDPSSRDGRFLGVWIKAE